MSLYEPQFSDKVAPPQAVKAAFAFPIGDALLYRRCGKRVFDLAAVVLSAPFWVPLIALLALFVWMKGGKPFYRQDRIGRGGKTFRILKLRTMVADADAMLESFLAQNPEARAEWDKDQKLKHDPRITPVGHFLRKTSLDELPQLWNVLKGEMSLVGPRPMMPDQRSLYAGTAYYDLRPGMTGSWQVSARNGSSFADRAGFDNDYGRDLSLSGDLNILAATVNVVLHPTGY